MSDKQITTEDLLSILEVTFRSGLQEIKRIKAAKSPELFPQNQRVKRKDAPTSKTQNAIDVLTQASRPMHILEIVEALEARGLTVTRDSSVSALTKILAPSGPILRTSPNTFTIRGR